MGEIFPLVTFFLIYCLIKITTPHRESLSEIGKEQAKCIIIPNIFTLADKYKSQDLFVRLFIREIGSSKHLNKRNKNSKKRKAEKKIYNNYYKSYINITTYIQFSNILYRRYIIKEVYPYSKK